MIYKIATGLPPNLDIHVAYGHVESRSKLPMLEEDNHTHDLKSLVSYCLQGLRVRDLQLAKCTITAASGIPTRDHR
jgi:hypothetical protein